MCHKKTGMHCYWTKSHAVTKGDCAVMTTCLTSSICHSFNQFQLSNKSWVFIHFGVDSSGLVCVWGGTVMALHGGVMTGRCAGCQVHTVGINSIWALQFLCKGNWWWCTLCFRHCSNRSVYPKFAVLCSVSVCRCKCQQYLACSAVQVKMQLQQISAFSAVPVCSFLDMSRKVV